MALIVAVSLLRSYSHADSVKSSLEMHYWIGDIVS